MKAKVLIAALIFLTSTSSNAQDISASLCSEIFDMLDADIAPAKPTRRDTFRKDCVYSFVSETGGRPTRLDINLFANRKAADAEFHETIDSYKPMEGKTADLQLRSPWEKSVYFRPVAPKEGLFVLLSGTVVISAISYEPNKLESIVKLIDSKQSLFTK